MSTPKIKDLLTYGIKFEARPNFTQLQLALAELGAVPEDYRQLRHIMEKHFNLTTVDAFIDAKAVPDTNNNNVETNTYIT